MLKLSMSIKKTMFTNAGNATRKENSMSTNPRLWSMMMLTVLGILTSSCTEFAVLSSGAGIAVSQNAYAKAYNAVDLGMSVTTKKGIKQHVYEKGKKYIVDWTKAKSLGITTKH